MNLIADFFNLVDSSLFYACSVLLIIGFIIWELPRSVKLIDEEYTRGLYPDTGRVVDFVLLGIGLLDLIYLFFGNIDGVVAFLKTPGITALFLVIMVVIPIIIALGYFKRLFARMDKHNSVTVFLVHGFLDLAHTVFMISLVILTVPIIGRLILGR